MPEFAIGNTENTVGLSGVATCPLHVPVRQRPGPAGWGTGAERGGGCHYSVIDVQGSSLP